jgi:hypothetical protein
MRDTTNMVYLLRKAAGSEQNQHERGSLANSNAIGVELSNPPGAHIMPPYVLDARHKDTGFNVCPSGF